MENREIARFLEDVAALLELEQANPFRVRAYRNAALTVRDWAVPMHAMLERGEDLTRLEFVGKDRARLHSYYITVFGAAGQNNPVRVAAAGRSIDELVRVNGKWLIQSRNVAPTTE